MQLFKFDCPLFFVNSMKDASVGIVLSIVVGCINLINVNSSWLLRECLRDFGSGVNVSVGDGVPGSVSSVSGGVTDSTGGGVDDSFDNVWPGLEYGSRLASAESLYAANICVASATSLIFVVLFSVKCYRYYRQRKRRLSHDLVAHSDAEKEGLNASLQMGGLDQ